MQIRADIDGTSRAIRILSDRFCRDQSAITSLTRDLYSTLPETRARGRVLLKMIERYASDTGSIQFLIDAQASEQIASQLLSHDDLAGRLREHEESFEEQELRRRRREAVVFHEGGGPVSQDDIIQRSADGVTAGAVTRSSV
ncbi:hypothetical protein, variant [Verruconis gallopava]|uniref:Uncharacterized protein n=1 Tax=Verruconis gallopava TaxID=253628 RepID=A0A0D2AKL5_9PEZI|nr:hypothetical protein, variant [Verruconis gallopava]KIV99528.1 hypothetical protein, variant [Verruconis gallopava]